MLQEINVRGGSPFKRNSKQPWNPAVVEIATLQSPTTHEQMLPHSALAEIARQVAHQIVPVYLYGESGWKLRTLCL